MNETIVTQHLVIAIDRMESILRGVSNGNQMKDACEYARKKINYQLNHNGEQLKTLVFNIEEEVDEINIMSDQLSGVCSLQTLEVNCPNTFWDSNHEGISALIDSSKHTLVSISLGFIEQQTGEKTIEMMEKFNQQFSISSRDMAALRNFSIQIGYEKQQISQLLKSIGANVSKLETLRIESNNQSDEFLIICEIFKKNKSTLREVSLKINEQQGQKQDLTQFFQSIKELNCLEKLELMFSGEEAVNLKSLSTEGWRMVSSLKDLKSLSIGFESENAKKKDWKPMLDGVKSLNSLEELSFGFNTTEVSCDDLAQIISRNQNSLRKLTVSLNNTNASGQFSRIGDEIKKLSHLDTLILNLEDISLKKKKEALSLFEFLLSLPNLMSLEIDIVESEFSDAFLKHFCAILGKCQKLQHLRLKLGCYDISEDVFNPMRLSLLQCKELVSLQLCDSLGILWGGEMLQRKLPRLVASNMVY